MVVGAGPVGLSVTLALRRSGIPVVVIDRRPGIPRDYRATTVQPRSLELLDEWGVLGAITGAGLSVTRLQYWQWSVRPSLLTELDYGCIAEDTAHPYRVHLDQWVLCEILLEAITSGEGPAVLWRHAAGGFTDRGDRVEVDVRGPDGRTTTHEVSLLIAADGHASTIREALGVPLAGAGDPIPFMSASLPAALVSDLAPVSYLAGGDAWTMVMRMADRARLLFQVPSDRAGARALSTAATDELARRWFGPLAEGQLQSLAQYTVRPSVAARWRVGRVALVGDAAHAAYPVDGTAMNCGIQDAHALVGALRAGTEAALDGYEASRRAWSTRSLIDRATESLHALSPGGLWHRTRRARALRDLGADPTRARAHLLRLSMLDERI